MDVLIIGAGMTGLMAAQQLQPIGDVLLLDKGKQVGGRMITRSVGNGVADLGAQFFTVHTPEFESWSNQWLAAGLITQWATGWSDASLTDITSRTYRRYIVKQGMSKLAEYLAQSLTVETGICVKGVVGHDNLWQIQTDVGQHYECRILVLTPPVPLALRLLKAGQVHLSPSDRTALQRVTYDPSLVAVFRLDGETKLPGLGAMQLPQAPIRYLVDNRRKGISPRATVVTTQADAAFSRKLWDESDEDVLASIETELRAYLQPETSIAEAHLHRWLYALPTTLIPQHYLLAADLPPLIFAGDAFGSLRGIEGSALSGLAAGRQIVELLQNND